MIQISLIHFLYIKERQHFIYIKEEVIINLHLLNAMNVAEIHTNFCSLLQKAGILRVLFVLYDAEQAKAKSNVWRVVMKVAKGPGTAYHALNLLLDEKIVAETNEAQDKRLRVIYLTEKGKRVVKHLLDASRFLPDRKGEKISLITFSFPTSLEDLFRKAGILQILFELIQVEGVTRQKLMQCTGKGPNTINQAIIWLKSYNLIHNTKQGIGRKGKSYSLSENGNKFVKILRQAADFFIEHPLILKSEAEELTLKAISAWRNLKEFYYNLGLREEAENAAKSAAENFQQVAQYCYQINQPQKRKRTTSPS